MAGVLTSVKASDAVQDGVGETCRVYVSRMVKEQEGRQMERLRKRRSTTSKSKRPTTPSQQEKGERRRGKAVNSSRTRKRTLAGDGN